MKVGDLKELLVEKAEGFSTSEVPPPSVVRRARRKAVFSILQGAMALTLLVAGGFVVLHDGPGRRAPSPKTAPVAIQLVDEYVEGDDEHDGHGDPVSGEEVQAHVACMREQGFDLPDPVRTEHGWEIEVADPESMRFDSPEWREAAFVTCSPSPPPGGGNLVLGVPLSEETIRGFEMCMEREGFSLPEATAMEGGGWEFHLADSDIDFGAEDWNRAVFITCWPEGLEP